MNARPIASLAMLLLAGCGGTFTRSPASDAATTKDDARLLGFWRVDYEASKAGPETAHDEGIVVVGRRSDKDPGLRVTTMTLRKGEILETITGDTSPTSIAGKDYASVAMGAAPEKPEDGALWTVLRYDLPDADTLRVLGMDEKKAAADVHSGAVSGTTSDPKKEGPMTVTIDASTAALRTWLAARGDDLYRTDHPLVLRRLHPR